MEKINITFNKGQMSFNDMERAVETLETINNHWHRCNDNGEINEEFFWYVNQQIQNFTTRQTEEAKKD